jgi:lipid-A-disaccharide synthase
VSVPAIEHARRDPSAQALTKIFFSAGEASGDALGASLMRELKKLRADLEFFGMGGPGMVGEGLVKHRDASEVAVVGLVEVLRHLPRLFRLKDALAAIAREGKPDLAVLIDVPDFNLRLARELKAAGIPVVFYVGPSVWAWRRGRVNAFRRAIDRLLVLFPFEVPVWSEAKVDAICVGHPLLDEVALDLTSPIADPDRGASSAKTIALLPGSRRSEIDRLLPVMLDAAARLFFDGAADHFVLPVAPTIDANALRERLASHAIARRIQLIEGDAASRRRSIAAARMAIVASGTATLETALLGLPQIIIYRFNAITFWIGKHMTKLRHLGLPNIIAGREVVPELLQDKLTAPALAARAGKLMRDSEDRMKAIEGTLEVRARMGERGAAARAADAVLGMLR